MFHRGCETVPVSCPVSCPGFYSSVSSPSYPPSPPLPSPPGQPRSQKYVCIIYVLIAGSQRCRSGARRFSGEVHRYTRSDRRVHLRAALRVRSGAPIGSVCGVDQRVCCRLVSVIFDAGIDCVCVCVRAPGFVNLCVVVCFKAVSRAFQGLFHAHPFRS